MSRLLILTLVLCAVTARSPAQQPSAADKSAESTQPVFRRYDAFNDQFELSWQTVREDEDHWSLKENPGQLTITTQRGTIHRDERNDARSGGRQAKNLFLIDSPIMGQRDFTLSTCIVGFEPTTHWQQAGLLLYDDDDNYTKFVYEHNGTKRVVAVLTEVEQNSRIVHGEVPGDASRLFLRILRNGDKYEAQASTDGMDYRTIHEFESAAEMPDKFGLIAKNGGNADADSMKARFEFFELTWK